AINSPLLEDVNLAGAHGILVNITAGMNLSIGEFEEVGNTVKEFASENATVVVGTVIDPEMSDELRVTVVATGLGREEAYEEPPMQLVQKRVVNNDEEVDYKALDRPTVIRNDMSAEQAALKEGTNLDFLDVPAFLRRQAD
ncbi:MAG TPA: cell division protein FtsZ, partial [Chromatiales bacterium]|nr:cell division protein FtsZ [Chromatiales bacterium]